MGPGTGQSGFAFHDGAPLCTQCGVRSARPCPPAGFYRTCLRCATRTRLCRDRRPRLCAVCREHPATYGVVTCSAACQRLAGRRQRARYKERVLKALGNACCCPGLACWHVGPCAAHHLDVLTVDHIDGSGGAVRAARRDGQRARNYASTLTWRVYWREIQRRGTAHLRCLCHNCHQLGTTLLRRAEPDPP